MIIKFIATFLQRCYLVNLLYVTIMYNTHSYCTITSTAILEGPVSVTTLVGTNAWFHCAGIGSILTWMVDGSPHHYQTVVNRGITAVTVLSSGTVQSNLTVPATSVNNGTTVQCTISLSFSSVPVVSNYSTLYILEGELLSTNNYLHN